jgi:hypothetical protein
MRALLEEEKLISLRSQRLDSSGRVVVAISPQKMREFAKILILLIIKWIKNIFRFNELPYGY